MPLKKTSSEHVSAERLGMAAFCLNALSSGVEMSAWMGMLQAFALRIIMHRSHTFGCSLPFQISAWICLSS